MKFKKDRKIFRKTANSTNVRNVKRNQRGGFKF